MEYVTLQLAYANVIKISSVTLVRILDVRIIVVEMEFVMNQQELAFVIQVGRLVTVLLKLVLIVVVEKDSVIMETASVDQVIYLTNFRF